MPAVCQTQSLSHEAYHLIGETEEQIINTGTNRIPIMLSAISEKNKVEENVRQGDLSYFGGIGDKVFLD